MTLPVTPDYGLSDLWHLNYPIKHVLSQSISEGKIPLWTDELGAGFPITAVGEIGTFAPVNWLIFGLLPFPYAIVLAFITAFLGIGIGTFLYSRELGLPKGVSLIAGLFASFNGYFVVQMTHLNLLQSYALIPFALWFMERLIKGKRASSLWLSLVLAGMILVGFPQTLINSVFLLGIYALLRRPTYHRIRIFFTFFASVILALTLAAVQLFPLIELARESDTTGAAARQRFIHPLPIQHLMTAIHPFLFGDPSRGTYPHYGEDWGMFWENLFFPGTIPLLLFIVSLFSLRDQKIRKGMFPLFVLLILSLSFALGKYTPLSIFFKLPPLSFTRVAARFLAFSHIFFAIGAAFALSQLTRQWYKHWLFFALSSLHVAQIIFLFLPYHFWADVDQWLTPPATAAKIPGNARIMSLYQSDYWNKMFLTNGWRGQEAYYERARNSLDPNSNMIFGIKQLGVYAQQLPKRQEMIQRNMYDASTLGEHIRDVYGVTHIIDASVPLFDVKENEGALPDVRVGQRIVKVKDMGEALGRMNQESFNPRTEALWESEVMPGNDEQVFVINRSFYPGWKAYLGKQKIPIYPVNINQQAVIVQKDAPLSTLSFRYDPLSYKIGGTISLISLIGWIIAIRYSSQ